MIEDDDKFKQKENLEVKSEKNLLRPIIVIITFLLWCTLLSYFFFPKVKAAINDSGVVPLIMNMQEEQSTPQRGIKAIYYSQDGAKVFSFVTQKRGSTYLHDTIEALINDYPEVALKNGCISLVSSKTKLIGLSVSRGICYVDLSKEFLSSPIYKNYNAYDQIKETLLLDDKIEKVVILVEGKVLDSNYFITQK